MRPEAERALNVEGFMQPDELEWLADRAAESDTVIEVGSWKGRSTTALCAAKTVYCVDRWDGFWGSTDQNPTPDVWDQFKTNMDAEITAGKVRPIRCKEAARVEVVQALRFDGADSADLVFIDADHTYEAVKSDIYWYGPLVKPGGLLCGHDYDPDDWPDVVRAVDEKFPDVQRAGFSIWWVRL